MALYDRILVYFLVYMEHIRLDIKSFSNPSGKFVKNFDGHLTFIPNDLPPDITYDASLITLIAEASNQLGELSGIGRLLPNPHLIIRPYVLREAVLSSKIEGTQASILDLFRYGADVAYSSLDRERKQMDEVVNYVDAVDICLRKIQKENKPVNLKMILDAHKILLAGVRGHELEPGVIRNIQNWIGPEGTKIENATYVPPAVEYVPNLLQNLENFILDPPGRIPPLIQCAVLHYQFESIHPFTDGNGRIGRLIIPLILAERNLLSQPLLYLSMYIESHKTEYYSLLLQVSKESKWNDWIKFFLRAIIAQARDAILNIQQLMDLKQKYDEQLRSKKASASVLQLLDLLLANPWVTITKVQDYLGVTYPPAKKAVEYLVSVGILREVENKERNRLFVAHEINDIVS